MALYQRVLGLLMEIRAHRASRAGFELKDKEEASIRDPSLADPEERGMLISSSLSKMKLVAIISSYDRPIKYSGEK